MRAVVLGASFAVSIGVLWVIGSPPDYALSRVAAWNSVGVFLLLWSVPVAIGLTASASASAVRLAKTTVALRYCTYMMLALAIMTIATPFWIKLAPWALGVAVLYALGFDRWFVRPHLTPAPRTRSRGVLSDDPKLAALEKGALLGASTALVIAIDHAVIGGTGRACGILRCPSFVDTLPPTPAQLFTVIAMHAVPVGILWGVVVGKLAHATPDPVARWFAVLLVALIGICIFSAAWPELLVNSLGIGLVHCAVLLSWTRREPAAETPVVRTIDRPRSTCCRGARSRGPIPTPSDTSRTTRSA